MGKPKARNRKSTALNKENEKAHRKPKPAEYSVNDILDRAESCLDECELQLAQKFCQRALEMDNDNLRALQLREGGGGHIECRVVCNQQCCGSMKFW
jgi:hypothetical protein